MSFRTARLSDTLQRFASADIIGYCELHEHPHGVIAVISVEVSKDLSYADIFVNSQHDEKNLPHFLAPCAELTKRKISKELSLRRMPILRYRVATEQRQTNDILHLISSLDRQYELSSSDTAVDPSISE